MSGSDTSGERSEASGAAAEGPVLIHVWEVDPAQQGVAVRRLDKMLSEVAAEPGFVSARLLESADEVSIAVVVEMRTVEDPQRLERLPLVRGTLDHLDGAMNIIIRLYHQVETYHA